MPRRHEVHPADQAADRDRVAPPAPRPGRKRGWYAAGGAGLLVLAGAVALPTLMVGSATAGARRQTALPEGKAFGGTPAVGALFGWEAGRLGEHFCTASVVQSPTGDLAITAAHCVSGRAASSFVFVPGYHDGSAPSGVWTVTRVIVDRGWASSRDPDDDFAFLVIGRSKDGDSVQSVTGGERIGTGPAEGRLVWVPGYPDGEPEPIGCENHLRELTATQLEFDCGGYTGGTSGSPFLTSVNPSSGLGTVVGVIGGYQQGGDTPQVSYAARFGADLAALYGAAMQAAAAPT
jgi:V8-like Glu-specific endopeptidase